ncbi:MAG: hypothetical protein IJU60_00270 [Acholeplasmatales bacterium]|nr:hypothetical protein [Acholeplasmatales bacterium]
MREILKIKALKLRRNIKVGIFLPEQYYSNEDCYKTVIALDGELFFNYLNEDTKRIDIDDLLKTKRCIFIAISSPSNPLWRISEVNPYYNGDNEEVDKELAYNFAWYINYELLPDLKQKYRISDDVYVIGMNDAANLAMYLGGNKLYSGCGLINYNFNESDDRINENLNTLIYKKIYMAGEEAYITNELKDTDNDIFEDKFINYADSIDKCIDFFEEE